MIVVKHQPSAYLQPPADDTIHADCHSVIHPRDRGQEVRSTSFLECSCPQSQSCMLSDEPLLPEANSLVFNMQGVSRIEYVFMDAVAGFG